MTIASSITTAQGELLRFSTVGSVDDGKSTLIGRLLFESKAIMEDQLQAIDRASRDQGADYLNLALLTDGLRSEREQGITIDVAYRYFSTPRRSFIMSDTPGHVQYTRNMLTGASNSDLAIVLLDASREITEQSRRHAFIVSLLRVPYCVVCVNKMDLVDYSERAFWQLRDEFAAFLSRLGISTPTFIPVSALVGDNVVERSANTSWYHGPSLLDHLETVPVHRASKGSAARFAVQWVIRPNARQYQDYRGYAGQVAGGVFTTGDEVVVLPSGCTTRVKAIDTYDGALDAGHPGMSVTLRLADDVDVSRGDIICSAANPPLVANDVEATLCWFSSTPLALGKRYLVKHASRTTPAMVEDVLYRLEVNSLSRQPDRALGLNDIGRVKLRVATPLVYDPYERNRATGSFIVIDPGTNETAAAGIID